jgi:hypothetical protein
MPRWPTIRLAQWVAIIALLLVSEVLSLSGHVAASWMTDGVALAVFIAFTLARRARRRPASSDGGSANPTAR